jgi:hypothetical protein
MASNYSNDRAEWRKANPGVNKTQRSWSNYEGDRPQSGWAGTDMYRNSERWGPGGRSLSKKDEDTKESDGEPKPEESSKPKTKDRGAARMLPPGYTMDEKGRVKNSAGYTQPDNWYTTDTKTGLKRLKTSSEMGMYDGGKLY